MLILKLRCLHLAGCDNGMPLAMGIQNSELMGHKRIARILIAGPEAQVRGPRKGEVLEANPTELTCFLSTTYRTKGRSKPKGDMSNGVSKLERNYHAFWPNLYGLNRATIKDSK
jgi:hypothetical protein